MILTLGHAVTTRDGFALPLGCTVWFVSREGDDVTIRTIEGRIGVLHYTDFLEYQ